MLVPVPVTDNPVGVVVNVQVPVAGKLFRVTLPVEMVQSGWVIVPTVGASAD